MPQRPVKNSPCSVKPPPPTSGACPRYAAGRAAVCVTSVEGAGRAIRLPSADVRASARERTPGFTGRTLGDPAVWKQQASFQENFPTLAPRGQFLSIYKMWSAYPTHYLTTDKQGFYDPKNIAVVDVDGIRCMELRVVSGKNNGTGKPSGATP